MRDYGLSWGETAILGCLMEHDPADPDQEGVDLSPSRELQEITGSSRKSLQAILKKLEEKGLITSLTPDHARGGRGRVHRWRIEYERMGWYYLVSEMDLLDYMERYWQESPMNFGQA
ncbi:MAG: hypothetical protein A3K23_05275 [Desulfobacca sp. RBG_16_58_9]|nr:MAG: hypothetical protein A3K23_05275 [Desulfobacca sp. RBG_16_58_9]